MQAVKFSDTQEEYQVMTNFLRWSKFMLFNFHLNNI